MSSVASRMAIDHGLYISYCILSNIMFGISAFLLTVLIIFRNSRFLKDTYPLMNAIILIGFIINHFAVAFSGLELNETRTERNQLTEASHIVCKIRVWCISLGPSLVIGGLLAKISRCMLSMCNGGKRVLDFMMYGLVVSLVAIDVVVLSLGEMFSPVQADMKTLNCTTWVCNMFLPSSPGQHVVEFCTSPFHYSWETYTFLGWKCLLLLVTFCLSVTYQIRKSDHPIPSDTQKCVYCIIVLLPISLIGLVGAKLSSDLPTVYYGILGGFLITGSTVAIVILFKNTIFFAFTKQRVSPQQESDAVVEMEPVESSPCPSPENDIEEIRQRLTSARKSRDETKLKQAIRQAKQVQAEELKSEILCSEQVLNGIYSVMAVRLAVEERNLDKIQLALRIIKDGWELDYNEDIIAAEKIAKELEAVYELDKAITDRIINPLDKALQEIEYFNTTGQYDEDIRKGRQLLKRLREIEQLRSEIRKLSGAKYAEVRSFNNPPLDVVNVMKATYLILGQQEEDIGNWKAVQGLLARTGKESLRRLTVTLEPKDVDIGTADYVEEMYLSDLDVVTLGSVSSVAQTFYMWCVMMIEESRSYHKL